jgi:hypothetical protein
LKAAIYTQRPEIMNSPSHNTLFCDHINFELLNPGQETCR